MPHTRLVTHHLEAVQLDANVRGQVDALFDVPEEVGHSLICT